MRAFFFCSFVLCWGSIRVDDSQRDKNECAEGNARFDFAAGGAVLVIGSDGVDQKYWKDDTQGGGGEDHNVDNMHNWYSFVGRGVWGGRIATPV